MGKIASTGTVSNLESIDELARFCSISFSQIITQVNGKLTIGDNISAKVLDVGFSATATEFVIAHGLGRSPLMWISGSIDANAVIFQTKAADDTNVYLEASAVCSAKILVI